MDTNTKIFNLLEFNKPVSDSLHKFKCVNYTQSVNYILKQVDWKRESSIAVIDDNNHIFGIITEQDMVELEKNEKNFQALQAWEVCSHNLKKIKATDNISHAIKIMVDENIHHLIVEDENANLIGVVSALDMLKLIAKSISSE